MPGSLRFGVVGMGHIGRRHASLGEVHPDYDLRAVCDIDVSKTGVAEHASRYAAFTEMLEKEELDVVSICVPNHLHTSCGLKALQSGAHVICEKPLGLEKSACDSMVQQAQDSGKHLFCVLQNRYSPTVQWLLDVVGEARLGRVFQVQVNCFWNRDDRYYFVAGKDGQQVHHPWHGLLEQDGGPLFTQFSHFIDILIALFGRLEVEDAAFRNFNHRHSTEFEDSGMVMLKNASGVSIQFNYTTSIWGRNAESSITVIGSQGTVKVGGQYMNRIDYCAIKDYEAPKLPETNKPNHYGGYAGSANNHLHIFEQVADVILRNASPDFPIWEAVHGVEVIGEIYRRR